MFKQPQELQKRQQLQDLGDHRSQNYINHLSSLKQASGVQFSPSVNGMPIFDPSQMYVVGNMHVMQHGGSGAFQGFPNRLIRSQSQNHAVSPDGSLYPQFDESSYGTPVLNTDVSFGMTALQSSSAGDYMNQQCELSFDEISMPAGSLLSDQLSQEKNLFEQSAVQNFATGILFSPESEGQHDNDSWNRHSCGKGSNLGPSSLNPLEQQILGNVDDSIWESSLSRSSNMSTGSLVVEDTSYMDALPSIQGGSWSALMQSAVAETSSSDTGIQEEWSGLSFQNPELSADYQHSNFLDNEKQHNNWVDENLHTVSGIQNLRQKEDFNSESARASNQHSPIYMRQLADYNSQLKNLAGVNQTSLPSLNNFSGHHKEHLENDKHQMKALLLTSELHSQSVAAQSGNMLELLNRDDISNGRTPALHLNSKISTLKEYPLTETTIATSAKPCDTSPILNDFGFRPGTTDPWTPPQSYSFSQSLPMGNSSASSSSHYTSTHIKSQHPTHPVPTHDVNKLPECSASTSQENSYLQITSASGQDLPLSDNIPVPETSVTSVDSHQVGFRPGSPSPWPDMTSKQKVPFSNSRSLSRSTCEEEILRNHYFETEDGASNSLVYDQAYHRDKKTLGVLPRDMRAFDHAWNQNNPLLYHMHHPVNAEINNTLSLPSRYDNVNHHQAIANARELLLSGHKSGATNETKGNLNDVSQLGAFSAGDNKGQNFLLEVQGNHLGLAYNQNPHQIGMFDQNPSQSHDFGNNEASTMTNGSQISLQMAPTWFKHYGTLKNEQMLPVCNQNAAFNEGKQFNGMTHHNLLEYSMIRQEISTEPSQGTGFGASAAATLTVSKQLSTPSILPSDVGHEILARSVPKKRKTLPFDMVPWYKEVNHEPSGLQNISVSCTAEIEWAQASNRRVELKNEAETFEDLPPVRAKRRLILTTQLMQKLFGAAPSAFLYEDDSSNCDCVVYSAARLALGDACRLTGQLPSLSNSVSPEMQKTSKRINPYDFSKVVEGLKGRVDKLECGLSRMDESLSVANIKLGNQELEKTSIINRFAKLYIKGQTSTIHPETSSRVSIILKLNPQRYVTALPMPRAVPEGMDCLSL